MASAHRRLLAHVRARDADAAAAEMEGLFRALYVMRRDNRGDGHGPRPPLSIPECQWRSLG